MNPCSSPLKLVQLQFRAAHSLCRRSRLAPCVKPSDPQAHKIDAPILGNPFSQSHTASAAGVEEPCAPMCTISDPLRSKNKSYAQVESLVAPGVHQTSRGLKPNQRKRPSPRGVRYASYDEIRVVEGKARDAGMSTNSFIRAVTLGSSYKPPRDPELVHALLGLNRELTAQGNNLNQIARHVNTGKTSQNDPESMLDVVGRSILRTHHAVRRALVPIKVEP